MNQSERKAKTHQKIVTAATRIFAEKGLEKSSLDEIVAEAKVGKGTLYNYYKSKEDMYYGIINHSLETLFCYIRGEVKELKTLEEKVNTAIFQYFSFAKENADLYKMIFRGISCFDEKSIQLFKKLVENHIQNAIKDEDPIFSQIPLEKRKDISASGLALMDFNIFRWVMSDMSYDLMDSAESIAEILIGGVKYIFEKKAKR